MQNKILKTAYDPRTDNPIVIYQTDWEHAKLHNEIEDCEHNAFTDDCLCEIVETLNNPNIIREGRTVNSELFIRYTDRTSTTEFKGFSVATKTEDGETKMTTAYSDVIRPSKGSVVYNKATYKKENNE